MANMIERATIEPAPRGDGFRVYLWGVYGRGSVLEGQPLRAFLCDEPSVAACRARIVASEYGRQRLRVEVVEHPTSKPYISLSHLPGENDPVPGGMYPDDIGEWPPRE